MWFLLGSKLPHCFFSCVAWFLSLLLHEERARARVRGVRAFVPRGHGGVYCGTLESQGSGLNCRFDAHGHLEQIWGLGLGYWAGRYCCFLLPQEALFLICAYPKTLNHLAPSPNPIPDGEPQPRILWALRNRIAGFDKLFDDCRPSAEGAWRANPSRRLLNM